VDVSDPENTAGNEFTESTVEELSAADLNHNDTTI
jgi:hypothetical protein